MRKVLPLILAPVILATALQAQDPGAALLKPQAPQAFGTLKQLTALGPRVTGSPGERAAHAWALAQFKALGLETGQQTYPLAHTWIRGIAKASLGRAPIRLAQWGWTPPTEGAITAPLVRLDTPAAVAQLKDRLKDRLKGAIVLAGPPSRHLDPLEMNPPLRQRERKLKDPEFPLDELLPALKAAGVRAVLLDAGKSGGLLNTNTPTDLDPDGLPIAFVAHGDYARLCAASRSTKQALTLELGGRFGGPGESLNTWGELKGAVHPEETVLLGAHLDAWDLATGATDNGAGVAAVLEAARLLKASGVAPDRTLRFVLFGGEEQGFLGSLAYVKAMPLDKLSAVFVMDTGAGAIDGFALQHRPRAAEVLMPLLAPLRKLGVTETDLRDEGGTDFVPFDLAGVPAFCAEQVQHDYAAIHHSEADTLAHVRPAELEQAAQVMAYTALKVADLPGLLPRERGPKAPEAP